MPRIFRSSRKFWVTFALLAVTFRIFTGAPEAQVNFTSLIVDQQVSVNKSVNHDLLLHQAKLTNTSDANSIPEKHRTFSTYKKYLSPDNTFAILDHAFENPIPTSRIQTFSKLVVGYQRSVQPTSHSPPEVVSAHSYTHTITTDSSVVLEKKFEKFKFNNSTWGFSGIKL